MKLSRNGVTGGVASRRQRRLVQPAFHNDRIRGYGDIMVRKTDQMLARWSDGEVRDVHADLMSLTAAGRALP